MYTNEGIKKAINGLKTEIENHNNAWKDGKGSTLLFPPGITKSETR